MVNRFGGLTPDENPHILNRMCIDAMGKKDIYPFGFAPTFHRYRLDWPAKLQRPRTIFVCSMADLFGDWVPLDWIQEVFSACKKAPQHKYLFLTKNPDRYLALAHLGYLPEDNNFWYGTSVPDPDVDYFFSDKHNTFASIEPILSDFPSATEQICNWVIIGAETGNRKDKVIPKREWIEHVCQACGKAGIPVFMKSSIRELMGEDFRQEYPWSIAGHV